MTIVVSVRSLYPGILLLVLILLSAGCLKESQLTVTGMTVEPLNVTAGTVILRVTTSVENVYGFSNGPARLVLQAFDTGTGLLAFEYTRTIGTIDHRSAVQVESDVVLPHQGSYRITTTIFEGAERKAQGEITVFSLDRLPTDSARTAVAIDGMDFIVRGVADGRAVVDTEVLFTNRGEDPSPPFLVEVKARERDARLLADRQWMTLGSIRPGSTMVQNATIRIPDQYNYEVEAVLWREDVIVGRGTGYVLLAPGTRVSAGEQFVSRTIETSTFISSAERTPPVEGSGGIPAQPGFTGPAALAAFGAVLYVWRRRHA